MNLDELKAATIPISGYEEKILYHWHRNYDYDQYNLFIIRYVTEYAEDGFKSQQSYRLDLVKGWESFSEGVVIEPTLKIGGRAAYFFSDAVKGIEDTRGMELAILGHLSEAIKKLQAEELMALQES